MADHPIRWGGLMMTCFCPKPAAAGGPLFLAAASCLQAPSSSRLVLCSFSGLPAPTSVHDQAEVLLPSNKSVLHFFRRGRGIPALTLRRQTYSAPEDVCRGTAWGPEPWFAGDTVMLGSRDFQVPGIKVWKGVGLFCRRSGDYKCCKDSAGALHCEDASGVCRCFSAA